MDDPLIWPGNHPNILAEFPPSLLISGTSAYDMSNAAHSHIELVKAGVDARLFLWDGLYRGFHINPDLPESQDAHRIIAAFLYEIMSEYDENMRYY